MVRFIIIVLLAVGAYFVYQNQDEIVSNTKDLFMKEKTVVKVNNASAQKEQAIKDAEKRALEY